MKITVLVDNTESENLKGEWGLSFLIDYDEHKYLLDTGSSALFSKNAEKLGVNLSEVEYAVLSHAHFDHSNGFDTFFKANDKAYCFMQEACRNNNCYHKKFCLYLFAGIRRTIPKKFGDRIVYVKGDYRINEGVYLVSHKSTDNHLIGKREKMYTGKGKMRKPDDFSHEQSLVFKTEKGLVIMNSCSHAGASGIINEVLEYFPGERVHAFIGGFHLYNKTEDEVRSFAKKLKENEVSCIYTGHCTGERAYSVLKEELGERIRHLKCGLQIEI